MNLHDSNFQIHFLKQIELLLGTELLLFCTILRHSLPLFVQFPAHVCTEVAHILKKKSIFFTAWLKSKFQEAC